MATRETHSFGKMVRTFPVRTALFTAGPVLFGLFQLINAYVHGTGLVYSGLLVALMIAFSVVVTQYHLVTFRRQRLVSSIDFGADGD